MTHELPVSRVQLKRAYEPTAPEDGVRVLSIDCGRVGCARLMRRSIVG